ncbi:MAG: HK97-gp10 family putative phage morphogenesis protein [Candidatus Heimdallarchaeaceae archaeon]
MVIRIDMNDIKRMNTNLIKLPKKLEKGFTRTNLKLLKAIRTRAKRKAPVDTGTLRRDISIQKTVKKFGKQYYKIVAHSPYAAAQEFGFKPHRAYIAGSRKLSPGIYWVQKNTPFMTPALEYELARYISKLNVAIGRVL